MLVDINLLPQKGRRRKELYMIIGIIVFLCLIVLSFYIWQIKAKEAELAEITDQLDITLNVIEEKNRQLEEYHSADAVKELEQAIQWAETKSFDLVFLIHELTRMLPERGFILDFKIDQNYKINQIIQFDTKSDAAYYLRTLLTNDWIEEAVISEANIKAEFTDEEEEAGIYNEDNVLPRYQAQYEILLNLQEFEKAAAGAGDREKAEEKGEETA